MSESPVPAADGSPLKLNLASNDVVAFVGGANTVSAQESGHLELLLTLAFPNGARFRSFAWEGDTVYTQPREVNFPSLERQLASAHVTMIFVSFGQAEALEGRYALPRFVAAYDALLEKLSRQTPRLVLLSPPPYEKAGPLLPDLSARNADLKAYVEGIRALAQRRGLLFLDVFENFLRAYDHGVRLTSDGCHLTSAGHWIVAQATVPRDLLVRHLPARDKGGGVLKPAPFEKLRQAIIRKNRLWFDYSRPTNWAFLGGDRTEQPSSRDHRNPKVRWFPAEMEKFLPLIQQSEANINTLARACLHRE